MLPPPLPYLHPPTAPALPARLPACSTPETLVQAVQKGVARARQADVHDLPCIVHQLLLLAGRGCRDAVLLVRPGGCWSLGAGPGRVLWACLEGSRQAELVYAG